MIVFGEHNNSGLDNELEGKQLVRFELGTSGFYGYIRKGQRYERGKYIFFTPDGPRYSHRFT